MRVMCTCVKCNCIPTDVHTYKHTIQLQPRFTCNSMPRGRAINCTTYKQTATKYSLVTRTCSSKVDSIVSDVVTFMCSSTTSSTQSCRLTHDQVSSKIPSIMYALLPTWLRTM